MGAAWVRDGMDMTGFPAFSSFEFFTSGLTAGFPVGSVGFVLVFGAVLASVLDTGLGAALSNMADLVSLAVGMGPPEIGNWFKYWSATSQQTCKNCDQHPD
ncbi:hypothetical protein [Polaromonas sp.]|uniref:hypothetical protein n=1 Tax=Polaromonas sp. TaxID=1869339 RepID=UPI0025DCF57B|nr:hypothetical protein [Polaromonas sp.]